MTRNPDATIVLPSEDEWYKAAYYDSQSGSYYSYPAGSNIQTTCSAPNATANQANCENRGVFNLTPVGSYSGSAGPFGTFDQGGNAAEWNETIRGSGGLRAVRGGSFGGNRLYLAARATDSGYSDTPYAGDLGCRLAMIPEPSTGLLVITGLLGLAGWRRVSA